jgi:hypothetical protein
MARMQEFVGTPESAVHMMRASCAGSMASCAAWLQRRVRRPRGHRLSFCYITKKTKKEVSLLDRPKPLVCCSFLFVCSSFPCRRAFLFFLSIWYQSQCDRCRCLEQRWQASLPSARALQSAGVVVPRRVHVLAAGPRHGGRDGAAGTSGSSSESRRPGTFRYCQRQTTTTGPPSCA